MIGIFGGTFDPIHHGHLRVALDVQQHLALEQMRLMPAWQSPLRDSPTVSAQHRAEMVRRAIAGEPVLVLDERESQRGGRSYTVETLAGLHRDLPGRGFVLVVGVDAFATFLHWKDWQRILQLAHVAVANRPGPAPEWAPELARLLAANTVTNASELQHTSAGRIVFCEVTQMDVSATRIRRMIGSGQSPRYLLPDAVLDYIRQYELYGAGTISARQSMEQ